MPTFGYSVVEGLHLFVNPDLTVFAMRRLLLSRGVIAKFDRFTSIF